MNDQYQTRSFFEEPKIKIGVIIPDRGDRSQFLRNCFRLMQNQTLKHVEVLCVASKPSSNECDITKRYRQGYDFYRGKGFDVIAFVENDDWYSPDYLETMVREWIKAGKPDLFGTRYTIYYNLRVFGYFPMHHESRSSAMSTLIKPDLNFEWCPDNEPYTDVWLYSKLNYKLFTPEKHICLGIKHGIGKTGGKSHTDRLDRYKTNTGKLDTDKSFLKSIVDKESFEFYCNVLANENKI